MFQSPRSGKFESNNLAYENVDMELVELFQSPRSGKFESNLVVCILWELFLER